MMICSVNDYLDYTLMKQDEFKPRPESVQVRQAMMTVLEIFKLRAKSNRIKFDVDFSGGIPKHLQIDRQRLQQVLRNYVGNAIKYTAKGRIKVKVRYNWAAAWLEVQVKDTGVGIKPENIKNLFKPFTQLQESIHMNKNGVGFSLYICKKIVMRLNGSVSAESKFGKGSNFKFSI